MKKLIFSSITIFTVVFNSIAQALAPYIKIGESSETIQQVSYNVMKALKDNSFTVLGSYNPSEKKTLKVIAFTREDLKNTMIKVTDRGALAATFKVGLEQKGGKVIISYTNPEYILRAYLGDNYHTFKGTFEKFNEDLKAAFSTIGNTFVPQISILFA